MSCHREDCWTLGFNNDSLRHHFCSVQQTATMTDDLTTSVWITSSVDEKENKVQGSFIFPSKVYGQFHTK